MYEADDIRFELRANYNCWFKSEIPWF